MKRLFVVPVIVALAVPLAYATSAHSGPAATKTSICHRTSSKTKPYVKLQVTAAQAKTHLRHAADIVPAKGACPKTILTATTGGVAFDATMVGESESPAGDPVGTGTATIRLRLNQGQVCFSLKAQNITLPAAGAHIHKAAAGASGAIVVPLVAPGQTGSSSGCTSASRALVKAILAAPADYYVNVHTTDFPGGATRGQLSGSSAADVGFVATVQLSGSVERPAGDPDGTGTATIRIRPDNQVCFRLAAQNVLLPAVGAHIHRGAAGVAGPIVVPFTAPGDNGVSTGCAAADPALAGEIKGNPSGFYVNIHTREFPAGAVRAQLG
jgi:CHRD domain